MGGDVFRRACVIWLMMALSLSTMEIDAESKCRKGRDVSELVSDGANFFHTEMLEEAATCFEVAADECQMIAKRDSQKANEILGVVMGNLASVRAKQGRPEDSIKALKRAIEANPSDLENTLSLGKQLCTYGSVKEGLSVLKKAVDRKLDPSQKAEALLEYAVQLQKSGDFDNAIKLYREGVKVDNGNTACLTQLVLSLHADYKLDDKACLEIAASVDKMLSMKTKKDANWQTVEVMAGKSNGHAVLLGDAMGGCGLIGHARRLYNASINGWTQGRYVQWLGGKAGTLMTTPFHRMGVTMAATGDPKGAMKMFKRAIKEKDPMVAEVYGHASAAYAHFGYSKFDKAANAIQKSLEMAGLKPGMSLERWNMTLTKMIIPATFVSSVGNLIRLLHVLQRWEHLDFYQRAFEKLTWARVGEAKAPPSNPVFTLGFGVSDEVLRAICLVSGVLHQNASIANTTASPPTALIGSIVDMKTPKRIRVGFLSSDFNHNGVGRHLKSWEFWNRCASSEVLECILLSTGITDFAESPLKEISGTLGVNNVIKLDSPNQIDDGLLIKRANIHMLLDMNGFTEVQRPELVALPPPYQLAPIQSIFHGYEGTYGGEPSVFDHLISDVATAPPEHAAPIPPRHVWTSSNVSFATPSGKGGGHFSETLLLLPGCKFPGGDLVGDNHENDKLLAEAAVQEFKSLVIRQAPALPPSQRNAEVFVFCNFAKSYKLQPMMAEAWFDILKNAPNSILWLLSYTEGTEEAQRNLRKFAESKGVDPSRIVFTGLINRDRQLQVKSNAHLLLDTTPYNGHMTAAEALWAGIPLLTLPAARLASRISYSMLKSIGIEKWLTARDIQEYKAIALSMYNSQQLGHSSKNGQYAKVKEILSSARKQHKGMFGSNNWSTHFERAAKCAWEVREEGGQRRKHVVVSEN